MPHIRGARWFLEKVLLEGKGPGKGIGNYTRIEPESEGLKTYAGVFRYLGRSSSYGSRGGKRRSNPGARCARRM